MTRALVKGLFHQLVSQCGGSPAAAAYLGLSDAYVRQLYRLDDEEREPNLIKHILPLEQFCGKPIVTRALAELTAPSCPKAQAREALAIITAALTEQGKA